MDEVRLKEWARSEETKYYISELTSCIQKSFGAIRAVDPERSEYINRELGVVDGIALSMKIIKDLT